MKYLLICICTIQFIPLPAQLTQKTKHVFIVTIDGVRWQEIFKGADSLLINNSRFTKDTSLAKQMFWEDDITQRRNKLLPFFWDVLEKRGTLYGNRSYNNKVSVSNLYKFSYPGYNEIFTGYADLFVNSNKAVENKNENIFEYLNEKPAYKDKIVAFTSWSVFPYILGTGRNKLPVFSGYHSLPDSNTNKTVRLINQLQDFVTSDKMATRYDELTFLASMEYIKKHQPKVVYLALGEPDESAHRCEYDSYLQQINNVDKMISRLWYFVQSDEYYKDKTTMLITTDHGRGKKKTKWQNHDFITVGSGHAWLAVIGPDIEPGGEMKTKQQIYQKQIANSIASLLGIRFIASHPVANAIDFEFK